MSYRRPGRWAAVAPVAVLAAGACDLPTDAPRWEQTWLVPGEVVSVRVSELLPAGVTLSADGSAFLVTTDPIHFTTSLAELCPPCVAFHGMVVPKPAFTTTISAVAALPDDVVSASVAGGTFQALLGHGFSFDPLRPGGPTGATGHLVTWLVGDGLELARDSISGSDRAFPPGVPLATTLVAGAAVVAGEIQLRVRLHSPSGSPTLIRSTDTLSVRMPPAVVQVTEATIRATDLELSPARTRMSMDLDGDLLGRVRRGAIRLQVANPFAIAGTLVVRLEAPGLTIERPIEVQPGASDQRIEFTGAEMRAMLGAGTLDFVTSGHVSAPTGVLTVRPDQELVLDTAFEVVILVGRSEAGA